MVDTVARAKLAEAARALVAGLITNDEFEHRIPKSDDPAILGIFYGGFWPNYGDLSEHRMIGDARWVGEKRAFAVRCIVFLKTDLPYRWPVETPWRSLIRSTSCALTFGASWRAYNEQLERIGDASEWPFCSQPNFASARSSPKYLAGL